MGYPYIVHVWGDRGYLKGAALQLFTLMYTLGIAVAPLIIEPFLVTLPSNVDNQTCDDVLASTLASWTKLNVTRDDNNVMHDAVTSPQRVYLVTQQQLTMSLTLANNEISQELLNSSMLSHQQDVSLARWAFSLSSCGNIITSFLLAVVCLMSQQTFTSSNSRSDDKKDATSKLTASVAFVCATIFFWASIAGSLTLYLQTYAMVGLGGDKSDASYLNTICAAGQVIGRLVCILLSSYISRRPVLLTVVLLVAGVGGLLLMMMGDLSSAVQDVVMRIGVFVEGEMTLN
jgi:fucose permease